MFTAIAVVGIGLFALVLIGGVKVLSMAPEPIDDSRQYWS